jgi:hypothetical protein
MVDLEASAQEIADIYLRAVSSHELGHFFDQSQNKEFAAAGARIGEFFRAKGVNLGVVEPKDIAKELSANLRSLAADSLYLKLAQQRTQASQQEKDRYYFADLYITLSAPAAVNWETVGRLYQDVFASPLPAASQYMDLDMATMQLKGPFSEADAALAQARTSAAAPAVTNLPPADTATNATTTNVAVVVTNAPALTNVVTAATNAPAVASAVSIPAPEEKLSQLRKERAALLLAEEQARTNNLALEARLAALKAKPTAVAAAPISEEERSELRKERARALKIQENYRSEFLLLEETIELIQQQIKRINENPVLAGHLEDAQRRLASRQADLEVSRKDIARFEEIAKQFDARLANAAVPAVLTPAEQEEITKLEKALADSRKALEELTGKRQAIDQEIEALAKQPKPEPKPAVTVAAPPSPQPVPAQPAVAVPTPEVPTPAVVKEKEKLAELQAKQKQLAADKERVSQELEALRAKAAQGPSAWQQWRLGEEAHKADVARATLAPFIQQAQTNITNWQQKRDALDKELTALKKELGKKKAKGALAAKLENLADNLLHAENELSAAKELLIQYQKIDAEWQAKQEALRNQLAPIIQAKEELRKKEAELEAIKKQEAENQKAIEA